MRYRKRIKIAKGINLNLSKSGASFSAGVKGASITVGKNGIYGNAGIPGSGLYTRQKLTDSNHQISSLNDPKSLVEIKFNIDENGQIIIKDKNDIEIKDENIIKKIKRTEEYKNIFLQLNERKFNEVSEETYNFINIFQYTPGIKNEDFWKHEIIELKFKDYRQETFQTDKPEYLLVKSELMKYAQKKIKSIFFWSNKDKRQNYVELNIESFYQSKIKEWEKDVEEFIEKENIRKLEIQNYNNEIRKKRQIIETLILKGDEEYTYEAIEKRLQDIELPVDFSIDYKYEPNGNLYIDMDLPEIEHLPTKKAQILQSGKISLKEKTQKELNKDYATCVCGLAFFFAGEFFNITPKIINITISGYTQRLSKITGFIEDQYIYSIIFKRDKFQKLNITKIDPIEAFSNFESTIKISNTFEIKTIVPFGISK